MSGEAKTGKTYAIATAIAKRVAESCHNDHEIIDGQYVSHEEDHDTQHIEKMTDQELDHMLAMHISDDEIMSTYDPEDWGVIDMETGEEVNMSEFSEGFDLDESRLDEVLSRAERIKSAVRFHRTQAKRSRRLAIALKRKSDSGTLNKRARRLAVKAIEKRLAKKPINTLSVSEKERIEARIQRLKPVIARLAVRMLPRVKNLENQRLKI